MAAGALAIYDSHAVLKTDRKAIFIEDKSYELAANSATILIVKGLADADLEMLQKKGTYYYTGFSEKSGLVKVVLKIPGIGFTLADCLLGLLFALMLLQIICRKEFKKLLTLPVIHYVFIGICLLSTFAVLRLFDQSETETDIKGGIKEWIQYFELFIVAALVFTYYLSKQVFLQKTVKLLWLMAGAMLLCGLFEYHYIASGRSLRGLIDLGEMDALFGIQFNPSRSKTAGSESSLNILSLYAAIILPFLNQPLGGLQKKMAAHTAHWNSRAHAALNSESEPADHITDRRRSCLDTAQRQKSRLAFAGGSGRELCRDALFESATRSDSDRFTGRL